MSIEIVLLCVAVGVLGALARPRGYIAVGLAALALVLHLFGIRR